MGVLPGNDKDQQSNQQSRMLQRDFGDIETLAINIFDLRLWQFVNSLYLDQSVSTTFLVLRSENVRKAVGKDLEKHTQQLKDERNRAQEMVDSNEVLYT